jgi:hypothetical protein
MNALRRTGSKEARRTKRQVAAWLDKGARLLNRLSSWPLGFENFREDVTGGRTAHAVNGGASLPSNAASASWKSPVDTPRR